MFDQSDFSGLTISNDLQATKSRNFSPDYIRNSNLTEKSESDPTSKRNITFGDYRVIYDDQRMSMDTNQENLNNIKINAGIRNDNARAAAIARLQQLKQSKTF